LKGDGGAATLARTSGMELTEKMFRLSIEGSRSDDFSSRSSSVTEEEVEENEVCLVIVGRTETEYEGAGDGVERDNESEREGEGVRGYEVDEDMLNSDPKA
jgi:hypothetical protein